MSYPIKFIAHPGRDETQEDHLLIEHLQSVGRLSSIFSSKLNIPSCGKIVGLLHDLGKYQEKFQEYILQAVGRTDPDRDDGMVYKKGSVDHSTTGAQYIYNKLKDIHPLLSEILFIVIASHHSGLIDVLSLDGENNLIRRNNKNVGLEECISNAPKELFEEIDILLYKIEAEIQYLFSRFPTEKENYMFFISMLCRMLLSCLVDGDRIDTLEYVYGKQFEPSPKSFSELYRTLQDHINNMEKVDSLVNKCRGEILNSCISRSVDKKGLYTLSAPTGAGKTLSIFSFALNHANIHNIDRIFYIAPFNSILDQNADTIRNIVGKDDILEWHSNIIVENEKDHFKLKLLADNWNSNIIMTSMVQLLESLFGSGTNKTRRSHNIMNSVIIFDEIQSLPLHIIYQFNMVINFLVDICGCTVILTTATQPLLNNNDIFKKNLILKYNEESEIVEDIEKYNKVFNSRVKVVNAINGIKGWTHDEISTFVVDKANEHGNFVCVVNTKKDALEIFLRVKKLVDFDVFHLSTNMCNVHRKYVLNQTKENLKNNIKTILISTQLIEAGVDISFKAGARSLSGLESIIQVAGRINRSNEYDIGYLYLFKSKEENISSLKTIEYGQSIMRIILEKYDIDKIFSDDVLKDYFKRYYREIKSKNGNIFYNVNNEGVIFQMLSLNLNAIEQYRIRNNCNNKTTLRQSFMTASKNFQIINTETEGCIVPYHESVDIISKLESAKDVKEKGNLLQLSQRYSINIWKNEFDRLVRYGIIREISDGIFILSDGYYDNNVGLYKNGVIEDFVV